MPISNNKEGMKVRRKSRSVDDQLTHHLEQAEDHLIKAVTLFNERPNLSRRRGYYTRLVGAQEAITTLHREELVRVRGPMRPRKRK